ncbi:MAG TPA: cytochrome c oxidase subunit II [Gammaproteobacteria bacterium]|nr:cytochrome c oxidase subunit II [Gammaproteobacteria bacterium]
MRSVQRTALRAAAALLLGGLLGGCASAPFNSTIGAGVEASRMAVLGWWLIGLMCFLTVGMTVLVVWGALRRRGTFAEHLPYDVDGGKAWILIGGVAVPAVVLTALFFVTLAEFDARPVGYKTADVNIDLTAHQWWWEFNYRRTGVDGANELSDGFETANEIHVPVGKPIGVQVRAADVIHSFWVPKLFGKLDAIPGHINYFVFKAIEPGVYFGLCAEFCGLQHANMQFTVVAESPEKYEAWVERQRSPAKAPQTPELITGRNAFEENACALCHTVRGTRARGSVAPDLTHVGGRLTIAAGNLPNTRARMQAWIVNAQAIKPGNRMPPLEQFDGRTLNALAAYMESLK